VKKLIIMMQLSFITGSITPTSILPHRGGGGVPGKAIRMISKIFSGA
jgi:hypothetical protein